MDFRPSKLASQSTHELSWKARSALKRTVFRDRGRLFKWGVFVRVVGVTTLDVSCDGAIELRYEIYGVLVLEKSIAPADRSLILSVVETSLCTLREAIVHLRH